uniref:Glycosyltransferase, GT2 family n=1 Tax=Candidatus Kentrum sp. UNK TaxID=2126344 RepID=A0A451B2Q2_9GAMM|nr:MAG: Glycosyltransferase, GT2 family [Candidatus Kentron sp. UNK]VFK72559.1 MAG: Glycosyltransferase, GT2 family [Candidatus Kentron sp. UNK]
MRFSLILATINRVNEPECLLHSLSAQVYDGAFEVIIIDQNPDDRLNGMVARYQQYFPILHLRQDKPLLARARNQGIPHIRGAYVGFPDDDCVYEPDTLSKAARFFAHNPQYAGIVGNVLELDSDTEAMLMDKAPEPGIVDYDKAWGVVMTAAFFMRAEELDDTRFDETIGPGTYWGCGEDVDLLLRRMDAGARFYFDPSLIVRHPSPYGIYSTWQLVERYSRYGRGTGYLMAKRQFPLRAVIGSIMEPIIKIGFFITRRRWKDLPSLPVAGFGRLIGYIGYHLESSKHSAISPLSGKFSIKRSRNIQGNIG